MLTRRALFAVIPLPLLFPNSLLPNNPSYNYNWREGTTDDPRFASQGLPYTYQMKIDITINGHWRSNHPVVEAQTGPNGFVRTQARDDHNQPIIFNREVVCEVENGHVEVTFVPHRHYTK